MNESIRRVLNGTLHTLDGGFAATMLGLARCPGGGQHAWTRNGTPAHPASNRACRWTVRGALVRAAQLESSAAYLGAEEVLAAALRATGLRGTRIGCDAWAGSDRELLDRASEVLGSDEVAAWFAEVRRMMREEASAEETGNGGD